MSAAKKFDFISSDGYSTLKLCGEMTAESAKEFDKQCEDVVIKAPVHVLVNCEELSALAPAWIRSLTQMKQKLKTFNKDVRYIFMNDGVQKSLKAQGVQNTFVVTTSMRAALVDFGLVTAKTLDVNFINPFLNATINVLKIQTQTEAKAGAPYKKSSDETFSGDISGVIGLVSESFSGSVVISFPAATFLKLMSRMLGEEFSEVNKDILDGAGEITNIIFGQAKVGLNEKGYGIKTALPSVISGKDHSVTNITRGPRIAVPFETDVGPFIIEICLTS